MRPLKHQLASRVLYRGSRGKQQEKEALEAILTRLGLGHYRIVEGERPDLRVCFRSKEAEATIACEVTAFYGDPTASGHGSAGARRFGKWRNIAERLRRELESKGLQGVYGVVFFKEPADDMLDAVVPGLFVRETVDVCLNTGVDHEIVIPAGDHDHLNALVEKIRLWHYPEAGLLWWAAHLRSGVLADPREELAHIVEAKTKKARSYNWGDATERWLLIIAEGRHLTDAALLDDDPRLVERLKVIGFDRVILWERLMDELVQLLPAFTKLCDSSRQIRNIEEYPAGLAPFVVGGSSYPTKPVIR